MEDIFWHIKNDEPYYILVVQGKKSGTWNKNDDL